MAHYGSGCPKREKGFTNNRRVHELNMGKLAQKDRKNLKVKTTVRTKGGGYQGSKELKGTQPESQYMSEIYI